MDRILDHQRAEAIVTRPADQLADERVAIARRSREEDGVAVSEPLCLQPSGDALELLAVQSLEEGKRRERIPLAPRGANARDDLVAVLRPTVEVAPAERPELDRFDRLDRRRADRPIEERQLPKTFSRDDRPELRAVRGDG